MKRSDVKLASYLIGSLFLGKVIRHFARKSWYVATKNDPPENLGDPEVKNSSAIIWTLGLSLLTATAKLIFRSFFVKEHNQLHGHEEPNTIQIDND